MFLLQVFLAFLILFLLPRLFSPPPSSSLPLEVSELQLVFLPPKLRPVSPFLPSVSGESSVSLSPELLQLPVSSSSSLLPVLAADFLGSPVLL